MTDKIVVLSACGTEDEAVSLGRRLVERKLAACVNLIPGLRSIYRWKGEIANEPEVLLLIKTSRALFPELRRELERIHSYEVPEVVALPILDGSPGYLDWLARELPEPGQST